MAEFTRPTEGFKFENGGVKTNALPDQIPPNKYASGVNVRSTSAGRLKTRPGYTQKFATGSNPVTDVKGYATLGTDDLPRFLARDTGDAIYLDTGSLKATLAGPHGKGITAVPFRPPASSQSWMYIAGLSDYQKFSAPDGGGNVTVQKVGIAEPQAQCEAATVAPALTLFQGVAANWTQGGTAGAVSNSTLISDTTGPVLADPVVATRLSVGVTTPFYRPGMVVTFAGANSYPVEEVWQACDTTTIAQIRYDSGTTGLCTVVPAVDLSSALGRGSIVGLAVENVLVLSVTKGINGTCEFRCSTTVPHSAGQAITGQLAIVVHGSVASSVTATVNSISTTMTGSGVGTISRNLTAGMFSAYTVDDYIHICFSHDSPIDLQQITIIFNVSGTTPDYQTAILTYTLTGALLPDISTTGFVFEIHFPISAVSTIPGALNPCNGIEIQITNAASSIVQLGGLWVGGGGEPDIGDTGAPYFIRARPRSSLTGAKGNPSPEMRYGILAHRQAITVTPPSAAYDSQIDTWDYFAKGGSVTTYGYIGSGPTGTNFTFNVFDDTITANIAAGRGIETENFEPWPTIDQSWTTSVTGGSSISITGSYIMWLPALPLTPASVSRWLPGTLLNITGYPAVTLRSRPVSLGGNSWLFEIEESIGAALLTSGMIGSQEPNVANQILPYIWGPDAYGTVFGAGDSFRPGMQYFALPYAPDIAPDTNNLEVSPPDEPLLGGTVKSGVSYGYSTTTWWAYYPNLLGSGYRQVEQSVGRIPVSPYGICTDKEFIYFWTRDGICRTQGGGHEIITADDLYNLFPHEGVPGQNSVRGSITYYAPDYSRSATFRLNVVNGYLFADYQDSGGNYRTLICDLRTMGWYQDIYGANVTAHYALEQQASSITTAAALYPAMLLAATNGKVYTETDNHNDDATAISGTVRTFEFDGQDMRVFETWGDLYLDTNPISAITVTPISNGVAAASAVTIGASASRVTAPVSVGGAVTLNYLGIEATWTDDFSVVSSPTHLNVWQPSYVPKPERIIDRASDWMRSLAG